MNTPNIETANLLVPVIASALGGAFVTGLITLLTYYFTGKREHKKWLKELKYKCYVGRITFTERFAIEATARNVDTSRKEYLVELAEKEMGSEIDLLGSTSVQIAHGRVRDQMRTVARSHGGDSSSEAVRSFAELADEMMSEMRRDLRVPRNRRKNKVYIRESDKSAPRAQGLRQHS